MFHSIPDLAKRFDMCSNLLLYHVRQQGIPIRKFSRINHINEADLNRCEMMVAKWKWLQEKRLNDPDFMRVKYATKRRYEYNKKKEELNLPKIKRLSKFDNPFFEGDASKRKPKIEPLTVVFEFKERIKRGTIIGGRLKEDKPVMVMIKYLDTNGMHSIADVTIDKIRHEPAQVVEHISLLHKTKIG